jgi:hypothetical protein
MLLNLHLERFFDSGGLSLYFCDGTDRNPEEFYITN